MRHVGTSQTGLGDLLIAVARLAPRRAAVVQAIARMLQIEPTVPTAEDVVEWTSHGSLHIPQAAPAYEPESRPPRTGNVIRTQVIQRSGAAPAFAAPVAAIPAPTDEENEPPLALEPLFAPWAVRALVSAAVATPSLNGPPDVRALVARLSAGLAVTEVPRIPAPTTTKGAQILIDRASGMVPFIRDAEWLANEISFVTGSETTNVRYFRGLPSRGVVNRRQRIRGSYEPPQAGVPVVLVSDFSLNFDEMASDRASASEWTEFLSALTRRGNPVIAFVPLPQRRWPAWLARGAVVIEWDRHTSLRRIRAAVRNSWTT